MKSRIRFGMKVRLPFGMFPNAGIFVMHLDASAASALSGVVIRLREILEASGYAEEAARIVLEIS